MPIPSFLPVSTLMLTLRTNNLYICPFNRKANDLRGGKFTVLKVFIISLSCNKASYRVKHIIYSPVYFVWLQEMKSVATLYPFTTSNGTHNEDELIHLHECSLSTWPTSISIKNIAQTFLTQQFPRATLLVAWENVQNKASPQLLLWQLRRTSSY